MSLVFYKWTVSVGRMTNLLYVILVTYVFLIGAMYLLQRKLMFIPDRHILAPEAYGLEGFTDTSATGADGIKVQLWYKPAKPGFPTILYFHGNAAHLGNRAGSYAAFAQQGFGLLALSYRGYGKSEGSPTEQGIYHDARAAVTMLQNHFGVPSKRMIFYGESLGSGVAVQMATEFTPGAVVLEAAYTSVANRAAEIYYYIPVQFLIRDRFDSIKKIKQVKAPLLMFHGDLDAIIPISHGKAVYAQANDPKKAVFFEHINHNDFDREVISAHVLDFAREHHLIEP